ncbi:MAG: MJ0042-type zinc finger domain-containing protein, partial [Betaproteobacteria bacterium]
MTEPKFTRCPGCATVFRVTAEQLALREGQVRCGQCRAVFDANDHLVSFCASAEDSLVQDDELMRGRPTVTLRSASALLPVAAVAPAPAPAAPAAEGPPEGMRSGEPAVDGHGPSVDEPAAHFGEPQPPEGSRDDASPDHDVSAGTEPEADGASGPA